MQMFTSDLINDPLGPAVQIPVSTDQLDASNLNNNNNKGGLLQPMEEGVEERPSTAGKSVRFVFSNFIQNYFFTILKGLVKVLAFSKDFYKNLRITDLLSSRSIML